MQTHPDQHPATITYTGWRDFIVRNAHGVAQEELYIDQYCKLARHVQIPAQFVCDNENDPDEFIVSFVLPNVPAMSHKIGAFLSEEDELRVCFGPFRSTDEEGRPCEDEAGWPAFLLSSNAIPNHTGTHCLRTRRKAFGTIVDREYIPAATVWSPHIEYKGIYLKLAESKKTTKKQLQALGHLDPDAKTSLSGAKYSLAEDESLKDVTMRFSELSPNYDDDDNVDGDDARMGRLPPFVPKDIDVTRQRSIVLGRHIVNYTEDNLFGDLSQPEIDQILRSCTNQQRQDLNTLLRHSPCGITIVIGAAGTGKTTVTLRLIQLQLAQAKRGVVASSTNAAVNNICRRADAENLKESQLFVRLHPEHLEIATVMRYDAGVPHRDPAAARGEKYYFGGSLAKRILQLGGVIPTSNAKLLRLRDSFPILCAILSTPWATRTDEQREAFGPELRRAAREIITSCDVLFSTTVTTTSKWARWFLQEVT